MGLGLATAGIGLYQTIKGSKEKRDAEKALEAYQRQQLQNQAENLRVSTLGADLQREEASRLASTQVDALQGGGSRALIGGLGKVEVGNQAINQQIGADLDQQQIANEREMMNEEIRIRGMQEARENADIEALSSQFQAGKQDMNMGLGNMVQGVGSAVNQFAPKPNELNTPAQELKSMGTNQQIQSNVPITPGLTAEQMNLRLRTRRGGLGVFDVYNYKK
jgi:hypothetical protein